jgi:hypothetical protein
LTTTSHHDTHLHLLSSTSNPHQHATPADIYRYSLC